MQTMISLRSFKFLVLAVLAGFAVPARAAEVDTPPPQRRAGFGGPERGVYKTRITPHWFLDNTRFWYRNDLRDGAKEFVVVEVERGARQPAFDHQKLATSISQAAGEHYAADRLPFMEIEFIDAGKAIRFEAAKKTWKCDLTSYDCNEVKESADSRTTSNALAAAGDSPEPTPVAADVSRRQLAVGDSPSLPNPEPTPVAADVSRRILSFQPKSAPTDVAGDPLPALSARPGEKTSNPAPEEANWTSDVGASVGLGAWSLELSPPPSPQADQTNRAAQPRPGRRQGGGQGGPSRSPDGKWSASIKDHNIFVRSEDEAKDYQLTQDGQEGNAYGRLEWAPDSRALVGWRIEPGDHKEVYLVQSSPPGGGRALLKTRSYDLPGDKLTLYELSVFETASRKQIKPDINRFEHGWEAPNLHWDRDGRHFSYVTVDRGHQRYRVVQVDSLTGDLRNLIDEKSDTFIWTAHTENLNLSYVNWLEKSDEMIYVSERDGWRHLYLVDTKAGKIVNQVTKGEYVVRGIDKIDEPARQVWFRASGRNPNQDPYFIQYYRVNFDGTGLTALTEGDGNHTAQYSPDRKYLIDTYSRVDRAPVHELRRSLDGGLVTSFEEADITELLAGGWKPPEVFVAKGRDGKTDIWGLIHWPRKFDPNQKYPVLEQIYAGPQGSYVPKSFSAGNRFAALTDLGFIVVQMDGMGTANRSKAFHDVCWKNLKDAGFPDRILWMKAAADRHPALDLTRVGVYGNSAGGQNAAGALLFHPEFYKVAVANSGCHDNRMDKASWNEQWMGYPVGPQYSECSNIDNAAKLRGHLMLVVGELDDNVPPETTFRLADALIRANKDFELLVVPNGGHGAGGAYGQRRLQDFFVRHLQGVEPPNRNAGSAEGG